MKANQKMIFVTIKRGQNAITLIELLVVIVIIGILSVISLPNFRKTYNSLQLNSFTRDFQNFMQYLTQRAVVERKIIYLNIDNEQKKYWAQIKDTEIKFKIRSIPGEIRIEITSDTEERQGIYFYPDGQIEAVDIKINLADQNITLTTKGVFGSVKVKSEE